MYKQKVTQERYVNAYLIYLSPKRYVKLFAISAANRQLSKGFETDNTDM